VHRRLGSDKGAPEHGKLIAELEEAAKQGELFHA
jgi:hypothetical protein